MASRWSSDTSRLGPDCQRRVSCDGSPPPPSTFTAKPSRISAVRRVLSAARSARRALRDLAAPAAGLHAAALDDLLEALEVALDASLHEAERVADLLHRPLGLVVHLQHDPGLALVEAVEGHHAGVLGPLVRGPGDALVGRLLG